MKDWTCKIETEYAHGTITDVLYQTVLDPGYRSMRPIHDITLHTELTRLAMAVHAIKSLGTPKQDICTFKTDSIGFYSRRKRKSDCLELANTTFAQLKKPKMLSQSEVSSTNSSAQVYRVDEKKDPLKSSPTLPVIETQPPELEDWTWTDHEPEKAIELALEGKSFTLQGHAGSGKTYLTKEIVRQLQEKGERVVCIAKTHVACSLLDSESTPSMTVNRFVYKYLGSYKGWIVLDEFSLCDFKLWAFLYRLIDHCKFICVGSWSQLSAVGGHQFLDTQLEDDCVEKSRMFHRICGGNRVVLRECRRADATLYNWYVSLCPEGSRYETPMPEVLAEAKAFFNGKQIPQWSLCIDHGLRQMINRQANQREKGPGAIWVKCPHMKCANAPQSFWLYPGQTLMAHIQVSKGGVKNGMFYKVKAINLDLAAKQGSGFNCEDGNFHPPSRSQVFPSQEGTVEFEGGIKLSLNFVAKHMRLTHALTISSSQGRTLPGVVEIISGHPRFTKKHLMICLSRATEAHLVQVR